MRAIDLYSGVGGWALGLRMAGWDVIRSYEWWSEANRTHEINLGRGALEADIRGLPLEAFPRSVDIVVGSPPCTQFSFANRGGNGDISDGLRDIEKFLEVVQYIRPRYWVMENVPRVAGILERELSTAGRLSRFRNLVSSIGTVDMADFGLPQRRRRMLAGHFPFELLQAYREKELSPTLGQVIWALSGDPAEDPVYGFALQRALLRDHIVEPPLDDEETRLNRESKGQHPVYNVMSFPDPLDRTSRTVTALCTRVSRESIVVPLVGGGFRRLTVRERASLQGFPITFQFAGRSYSDKLKLVGNALPPLLAYYIGRSLTHSSPADVEVPRHLDYRHSPPTAPPPEIGPKTARMRFPQGRRFRAVVPHLRFGSGVRFEVSNSFCENAVSWSVHFYYGTSRDVRSIELDASFLDWVSRQSLCTDSLQRLEQQGNVFLMRLESVSADSLQAVWTRRKSGVHPHDLVDELGDFVDRIYRAIPASDHQEIRSMTLAWLRSNSGEPKDSIVGGRKLSEIAVRVFVGLLVGGWVNARAGLRGTTTKALATV